MKLNIYVVNEANNKGMEGPNAKKYVLYNDVVQFKEGMSEHVQGEKLKLTFPE